MKRILAMSAAALMGASMLAGPALSQDGPSEGQGSGATTESLGTTQGPDGRESTIVPDGQVDGGTTSAIDGGSSFDGALGAMSGNAASATAIGGMANADNVEIVWIDQLDGYDGAAIDERMAADAQASTDLQAAVAANADLAQALEAEGVEASQVVAAEMAADGGVTLYVR